MKSIRLLVADDIPQVRQGLTTVFRLATKNTEPVIEVIGEAKNGCEAIQQSQILLPDVVLMDLEMPVLNGYIATHLIKEHNPSIFVIILTIHDDPASHQKAKEAGADAFFAKNAPLDRLIQLIQNLRKPFD